MTPNLESRFRSTWRSLGAGPSRLLVAVSGGPDSVALLELLAACAGEFELSLTVAHVDHGIAPESAAVARGVAALAARHRLPLVMEALALGPGTSETAARSARWSALERMRAAADADWIVTAHHADDQAETVLMRVLRGSGPAGLAGMQLRTRAILRPLLPFRREELAQYLHDRGIPAWSDPANSNARHDRVWIRQQVLPLLGARWPDVSVALNRVASEAERWREAWQEMIAHVPELDLRHERDSISVAGGALRGYSSELARAVVRALGLRAGVIMSGRSAERVMELVARGRSGSWVPIGRGWRAAMAFGRLRIEQPPAVPSPVALQPVPGTVAWGEWSFHLALEAAPERQERRNMTAWVRAGPMTIRAPQPGDRLQPLGGTGHRTVSRLMQGARIPLGQRRSWPVLEVGGAPVWLPGVCRSQAAMPLPGTEAMRIDADHR